MVENKKSDTGGSNDLSFEEALEQLEKIVDEMEGGDLKLDESLDHFERGMKLARQCGERLGKAEKRIEVLVGEAGGKDESE
jgi:exodeoxyribonuclease VII small subunit